MDDLRQHVIEQPDVLSAKGTQAPDTLRLPVETPCFRIDTVEWRGAEAFAWLPAEAPIAGACIGLDGLRTLRDWAARRLIARGYVTSQVTIPAQDLSIGRLIVEILPGRIGAIRDAGGGIGRTGTVFPHGTHALLNVRDLDQALENLRRLQGQTAATFDLVPGGALGETDVIVRQTQDARRVHVVLTADNAGLDATGRNQLGAVVAIDSPLHLYDQLVLAYNVDAALQNKSLGSQSRSISWNVPFGYAALSLGVSESKSRQTLPIDVPGIIVPPLGQRTRRYEAGIGFVPYRSSHGKTSLRFRLTRRDDHTWLGSTELDVFRRDSVSYDISIGHLEKRSRGTIDAAIGVRGSLAGWSARPGRISDRTEWDGRYQILTLRLAGGMPVRIGARHVGYRGSVILQHTPGAAPSTEFMQIGGRYTVRGFDGNNTIAGASGWTWRNELATGLFDVNEAYAALDAGRVSGTGAYEGAGGGGRTLIGVAFGLRGGYRMFGYDIALGMPVHRPSSLQTATPTLDVSLTSRF
ncbi:ShlB/FhaC/HecB family hemolysin secretion/activation protein [Burkholderia territorii]|uniref:ShlB/FhaC/HecB family hemolysin secretion/activation protein n=1 Tax=Burkholderia territorii TaxID=1503055 RepID=UPI000A667744|nr:ShlB/FhaC/HecB family hemolysin secretion/activation protein [Burkholderia territorii]